MDFYLVKLRRYQEYENVYEAATADEALELARLEAGHDAAVTDEWADVDLVEALDSERAD